MKKIAIILAVAALAACTKSEVKYDAPAEIGFAPATKNITKAEGMSGNLADGQKLGVWAYWDNDATPGAVTVNAAQNVNGYNNFTDNYLVNALFAKKGTNWGGDGVAYPWPVNGALVFAGYTTPGDAVLTTDTQVAYNLTSDVMTFTDYENTNEFDLCWFGRTASSYNHRATGDAVPVELSHALTWVSIAVYGEGTPVGNWTITSMTLNAPAIKGTATCNGQTGKATWSDFTTKSTISILDEEHTITAGTTKDGETTGVELTDDILIPTTPVQLTVNYEFKVGTSTKTDSKTVSLKLNDANTQAWESGVHYTYTLVFKGNEILVAPSYGEWTTSDQTITVE